MVIDDGKKLIHLLYVPTIYCNLGCKYCYLGTQTDTDERKKDWDRALSTLQYTVDECQAHGIIPFNVSLHGGEVTTLPKDILGSLFQYITDYYQAHREILVANGFKKKHPHVKTNLFNFDKLYDLFVENNISISASVDLPLALHEKYRVTKGGGSTLKRTLANIKLLVNYPHRYKMSGVLYDEHLQRTDEIISDIWTLHSVYGVDMNHFNFMFGFESQGNDLKFEGQDKLTTFATSDQAQVEFYNRLKEEFLGTELDTGFKQHWFDEFTPNYCTNSFNCGEKFFLLQSDGNMYSCVRGQGVEPLFYGNIFDDGIEKIMATAEQKVVTLHRSVGMHADCQQCEYLFICQTGCPSVKHEQQHAKSYTCALQKAIYRDYPELYPATSAAQTQVAVNEYVIEMHPHRITSDLKPAQTEAVILPDDLEEGKNTLAAIIAADNILVQLYSDQVIHVEIDGDVFALGSQILKPERKIVMLDAQSEVSLHIKKSLFSVNCDDQIRNRLLLQFLRDTPVVYGDEQRTKQEHTYNHEVFMNLLSDNSGLSTEYYCYNLTELLSLIRPAYITGVMNNLFVTTSYIRQYHYEKQKNNAFYHIQAINLPFQNFEFYWQTTGV